MLTMFRDSRFTLNHSFLKIFYGKCFKKILKFVKSEVSTQIIFIHFQTFYRKNRVTLLISELILYDVEAKLYINNRTLYLKAPNVLLLNKKHF